MIEIRTGIPQAAVLGLLFFSIYVNDITKVSAIFKYIVYSNATTLYSNLEDFVDCDIATIINRELQQ